MRPFLQPFFFWSLHAHIFFFNSQKICFLPTQVFIYGQFSILFYDLCNILPSSYLCFHLFNFDVFSADYGCGVYYLTIHLLMLHVSRHVFIYSMHFDILIFWLNSIWNAYIYFRVFQLFTFPLIFNINTDMSVYIYVSYLRRYNILWLLIYMNSMNDWTLNSTMCVWAAVRCCTMYNCHQRRTLNALNIKHERKMQAYGMNYHQKWMGKSFNGWIHELSTAKICF